MRRPFTAYSILLLLIILMMVTGCATIKIGMISPPTSDTKLRVYVHAFSQSGPNWPMPHEKFVEQGVGELLQYLKETGIFTIVSKEDIKTVLSDQYVDRSQLLANNSSLARQIGTALYADYIILVERMLEKTPTKKELVFTLDLIKTDTGRKHSINRASTDLRLTEKDAAARAKVFELMYRELFREAQKEMMTAAARKADLASGLSPAMRATAVQPRADNSNRSELSIAKVANPTPTSVSTEPKRRLVVFDFEASDQYKTMAHILTESFREELLFLDQFVLVNRENLQQVLQEQSLQQSGLVDEGQAVKTGKGLAAKQVVTGGLGLLGKTFFLQIKLIDVETHATLNLVSSKFPQGNEDEVMGKMHELAIKLTNRQ